jgi:hypothetical protein
MKKYILLLLILFPFISNAQWSVQSYQFNVLNDGKVGIGTTAPTSRLHVFGNGTASNLFNLINDKDIIKDSSVVVTSNGSFCSGTNTPYPLTKNTFMLYDNTNTGIFNTTWIDSTTVDSNKAHQNNIHSLNTEAYGYFGLGGATLVRSYGDLANSLYMGCYSNSKFHLLNEDYVMMTIDRLGVGIGTTSPQGAFHVKDRWGGGYPNLTFIAGNDIDAIYDSSTVIDYFGKVGIGTTTPKDYLDINGNITFPKNQYIFWNAYNNGGTIYQREQYSCVLMYQNTNYANTLFNIDITGVDDAGDDIPAVSQTGVLSINTSAEIIVHEEIIWRDSVGDYIKGTTLSDNEAFALPTGYLWKGEIDVDSLGYTLFTAQIRCDADGTPYLEGVSWKRWSSITYVEVGSTHGYLNITDGGSGIVITNTLGYTIKATLRFRTKQ